MATRQVPVAAFPFTAMVNETLTQQTPVAGSALINQTASAGGGGRGGLLFRGVGSAEPPRVPGLRTLVAVAAVGAAAAIRRNPVVSRLKLLRPWR